MTAIGNLTTNVQVSADRTFTQLTAEMTCIHRNTQQNTRPHPHPTQNVWITQSTWQPWLIFLNQRRQVLIHNGTPNLEELYPEKVQDLKHTTGQCFAELLQRTSFIPERLAPSRLHRPGRSVMWGVLPEAEGGCKHSKTELRSKSSAYQTPNTYQGGGIF